MAGLLVLGVYQVYGGGLADLLSDELPDSATTAETTSAYLEPLWIGIGLAVAVVAQLVIGSRARTSRM